ncbi:hypothetical protein REH81_00870 [Vibrio rotiferianus]
MLRNLALLIALCASIGAYASSADDSELTVQTYLKQLEGIINAAQNNLGLGVFAANNSTVQDIKHFCEAYGGDCNGATVTEFNHYSEKYNSDTVVKEKNMINFSMFTPLEGYPNTETDLKSSLYPLLGYVKQIKALCKLSSGNLQQRCLHDNESVVKNIFHFIDNTGYTAAINDFNVYLEKERKKGLDEYLAKRALMKEGKQDITIKGKQFCSMYNSLLASSGLLDLIEKLDIDKELPGYQRSKQELLDSLAGSKSIWEENCI